MKHKVIALTGDIGSGKSLSGAYLSQKGFSVIDCDEISRQVADLPAVITAVRKLLGKDFVEEGKLNRKRIREVIFVNDDLREKYNNIFFPQIAKILNEKISDCSSEIVFVEIPILDAVHLDWYSVWEVVSDTENKIKRVMKR
ncbi:MAG: dephospho-CoA kinase, partial [Corallococcus sp.]|nr:dephospho-CoA kinase [Corallococcus sp.]